MRHHPEPVNGTRARSASTGRAALVTGCGSDAGIGFACARSARASSAPLVTITSTTDRIETRAAELRAAGASAATPHVADLTDGTPRRAR